MTPSRPLSHVPGILSVMVLLSRPALAQESPPAPVAPPAEPAPLEQTVDLDPSFLVPQTAGGEEGHADHGSISHTPAVIFTSDGKRMITATSTDEIVIFDAATRKILKRIKIPEGGHDGVSIDARGRYAAWVVKKGGVIVMDLERGDVLIRHDDLEARWVAIDPGGLRIAVSRGKEIEIRQLHSLQLEARLEGHEADITNLAWSADGRRLGSTAQDGALLVHHVDKRRVDYRVKKGSALHALVFSPKGEVIAYGGMDNQIYVYDFDRESESLLTKDTVQPYWITCLGFSPDGRRLAVGDESCDIWLYDMVSGKRIFHNKHHVECWLGSVAWAPDNETFLFGCRPNTHSQRPDVYQALARAEAARDGEVRKSRERLLEKVETELAKVTEAATRSALEEYQKVLSGEDKVQSVAGGAFLWGNAPAQLSFQSAGDLSQVSLGGADATLDEQVAIPVLEQSELADLAQSVGSVQTEELAQTAAPVQSLALANNFNLVCQEQGPSAIDKLPPELRKLATEHQALLESKMEMLSKKNFCINQWKVKGK